MQQLERKPITQLKGHPSIDVTNMLVKEANWNSQFGDKDYKSELIRNLARQSPNRLYVSPDGRIMRVLFYSDQELSYQAYIETMVRQEEQWTRYRSEFTTGSDPKSLEEQILRWRRTYAMSQDILANPYAAFSVQGRLGQVSEEYLHVVKTGQSTMSCLYFIGNIRQPYILDIRPGVILPYEGGQFRPQAQPPSEIFSYTNPF